MTPLLTLAVQRALQGDIEAALALIVESVDLRRWLRAYADVLTGDAS